ncbi:MAG: ABC transporter permease [Limnochordaceae bacterium]|uniref:ABC transporter permease n=1 Tax=Carboxydichorda subterranea TaxID=3109565 RepID=A0ABZ1BZG3_9FIRM|nr:ABC transporter permease [Limnochorda sp. L945t]MBE3598269.1 ABC transporter permease [Limnochordaceae bacterium]WRP18206.1 ABC transporter permease [Limnochorda sp. L945t]
MDTVRRYFRNPMATTGFVLLMAFLAVAILAPVLAPPRWPDQPFRIPRYGFSVEPKPPTAEHPFGLTEGQYDVFYGVIWGTRTAFLVGVGVVGAAVLIGLVVGTLAGYFGGRLDELLMRIADILQSVPYLMVTVIIVAIFGKGLDNVGVTLALLSWMPYARLVRGSVLQTKSMEFVEAARAIGLSPWRIMLRHVLPNSIFPVLVQASLDIGAVVGTVAALSFLGLGAEPGFADWGQLTAFSRNWILGRPGEPFAYWYTIVIPGMAIVLFVLAWNLIGDGLRDVMDPRLRREIR